ncbi:MAG TPA: tail fiber domain-containing protein, partial [Puia sp.]|nr:tail fiber domain-containing protein [Puia sp.]
ARILLLLLTFIALSGLYAQNIGINATGERPDASAILDIKSDSKGLLIPRLTQSQKFSIVSPAIGLTVYQTDGFQPGFYVWDGSGWWKLAQSSENLWGAYNNGSIINVANANVGINTSQVPINSLQVGNDGGYSAYDFVIGRNSQAMAIYQGPNFTNWSATDNISINPKNGAGYVGINAGNPANKLQIGSVGATNFATNDLAIGNGTNAFAIFQTDASTLMGSTTDIVLKPRNNGHGRVGINTSTPRAPLDVADIISIPNTLYTYANGSSGLSVHNGGDGGLLGFCDNCTAQISIIADNAVYAKEFDAYSDARIKDIIGETNSTQDLATLNALQVTNYTMKDKVSSGNRLYKKVIAQQVESVYPQVVKKHTDFIPNVYQAASRTDKIGDDYLLTFEKAHQISSKASILRLITDSSGMQQAEILGIPNPAQVLVHLAHGPNPGLGRTFVYGEQVDDFRTVDYEGLTTLHISATQELTKLVSAQQARINELLMLLEEQQGRIDVQEQRLDRLERKMAATGSK